jgi:hypothetical protein
MVAFSSNYIYYCFANYNSQTSFSVTSVNQGSGFDSFNTGILITDFQSYVVVGWEIINVGFDNGKAVITSINDYNGYAQLIFDQAVLGDPNTTPQGNISYTLTNPGNIAIWKRIAWAATTW